MQFGRIKRDQGAITLPEWKAIVAAIATLEPVPLLRVNPFTKESILAPDRGGVYFVVDGKRVGSAVLEQGAILTSEIPRELCDQIANSLGAMVFEDDRS